MSDNGNEIPLDTVGDGRAADGRFAAGNKFAKGNPFAQRTAAIRAALMEVCTPEAVKEAATRLMELAKAGDRFAFAELLDRTIGKAVATDLLERIEALEARAREQQEARR